MEELEELLSDRQVAKLLNVSRSTVQKWRVRGVGPSFIMVGNKARYRPSVMKAYITRHMVIPPSDALPLDDLRYTPVVIPPFARDERMGWSVKDQERLYVAYAQGRMRGCTKAFPERSYWAISCALRRYRIRTRVNLEAPLYWSEAMKPIVSSL